MDYAPLPGQTRYRVVSPQEAQHREVVGAYYELLGWMVEDRATGTSSWSGSERDMRATARALNRREAHERRAAGIAA